MLETCDYCQEEKEKMYLLSNHHNCCSGCLDDLDSELTIIDPDAAYDRYKDKLMLDAQDREEAEANRSNGTNPINHNED